MAKRIEPDLKKIGEYLSLDKGVSFIIPEYQRAYSWEVKQCDKLWQDIEDFILAGAEDPYFFGTIIISCEDKDNKLNLIDGQQRTTTFILLFKALLICLEEAIEDTKTYDNPEKLKRTLGMKRDRLLKILYKAEDDEVYDIIEDFYNHDKEDMLNNLSINELYKDELSIILNSKTFAEAEKKVTTIKYKQKDNKYTNFFRNFKYFYNKLKDLSPEDLNIFADNVLDKTEIIEIRSWNVEQAITMFNSLNSAGMPLLDADIISAQLYSKAVNEKEDFINNWSELKKIVSDLEKSNVVNIDDILKQYMYIKRAIDKEYISEGQSVDVSTPGIRRYYTDLNKKLLEDPLRLTSRFLKIAKIWDRIKDYSIVQLAFKFNENIKVYLISYLYRFEVDEISEKLVSDFMNHLLRIFVVLELVDTGFSSARFKSFLFGLNTKLVDENIDLQNIQYEIKTHIEKNWNKADLKERVLDYTKNPLVYLDEYIYCKKEGRKFILPEKYEIEHIMPRSGRNIEQIREDAGLNKKEEFLDIVNKLGNKILLEDNINRSLGNEWFRSKIQSSIKEKAGYKDSVFCLPVKIAEKYEDDDMPKWTVEDINNRNEVIAENIMDFIFE
ncbi:DUF262 domain-containing HNH endonuclease family protein [uncultured Ezakiella sp.]|uniref:DUF262 domain-containing protein n=1 Tax=uncultured Ezakiella sp. TaxID=1637529 RepID=UPI0025E382DA|nr:DUF262 domain-containing HNH endonuclease family protein [uncultured Ezakiella sp.]